MKIFKKAIVGLMLVPLLGLGGCSFFQVVKDIGTVAGAISGAHKVFLIFSALPPASDLASFNASQATQNIQLSNASLASTSGNVTIKVSDQSSGAVLGQQTFAYHINSSHQVFFNNPTSATNWVRSFSNYGGYVKVEYTTGLLVHNPAAGRSGSLTATAMYQNNPYASGRVTIDHVNLCRQPNGKPRCSPK